MELISQIKDEKLEVKVQKLKENMYKLNIDEEIIENTVQEMREKEVSKHLFTREETKQFIEKKLDKKMSNSTFTRVLKDFPFQVIKASNRSGLRILKSSVHDYIKAEMTSKGDLIKEINQLKKELAACKKMSEQKNKCSKNEQINEVLCKGQTSIEDFIEQKDDAIQSETEQINEESTQKEVIELYNTGNNEERNKIMFVISEIKNEKNITLGDINSLSEAIFGKKIKGKSKNEKWSHFIESIMNEQYDFEATKQLLEEFKISKNEGGSE